MVWIPHTARNVVKTPTPGYVLDAGTVSNPDTANVLTVSAANPINIPISYGRRAIFGVVIWSGNFKTTASSTGEINSVCDFAVAFGYPGTPSDELQEVQVSRIWIEDSTSLSAGGGRLIFDRTTPGGYALSADLDITIYDGSEEQVADELIVASEGVANAVPFRGMVYIVFRKFNLAKWGLANIPQLRAELVDITEPINYWVPFEEDGINAKATLTFQSNPTTGMTVTIDGHVYTFTTGDANAANKVHVGANIAATIKNLMMAINGSGLPGNDTYGVGTTAHATVKARVTTTSKQLTVIAQAAGSGGNSIAVSETIAGTWSGSHLAGALGDAINLPDYEPIGVDWQRNRVYAVSQDSGHKTLRLYDMNTMREIARGAIKNESGVVQSAGNINTPYLWQVDEATGTLYTTFGGTTNNVPLISINPSTQRITSRIGRSSTSFPQYSASGNKLSFPVRMRFGNATLGYGMCSGTRRYAFCATEFNEIFVALINTDGTLAGHGPQGNWSAPDDIDDIALQDSILNIKDPVFIDGEMVPGSDAASIYGFRVYVAAGNKIYQVYYDSLFPNYENPTSGVLATLPTGARTKRLVWNPTRKELLVFYNTSGGVTHLRRYLWVLGGDPAENAFLGLTEATPNVLQLQYDKVVPTWTPTSFETGQQYSKLEVGQYGYQAAVGGHAVAVVVNSQDGRYKTYPFETYVEYNSDFAVNETADPITFDYNGHEGAQPFCAAGGYYIGRIRASGVDAPTVGLMYVDGILNFRVALADLLRWLALSAGYSSDNISIDPAIDDKILGSIIQERTDIFSLIEALGIVFNFRYFESEDKIKFVRPPTGDSVVIAAELDIDNIAPTNPSDRVVDQESLIVDMNAETDTPDSIALTFIDFTNDYQASTVTARKSHFPFSTEQDNNQASYNIPIIMVPSEAIEHIYKALYTQQVQRLTAQFRTGPEYLLVEPMDAITVNVNDVQYTMSIYETTMNDDYSVSMGAHALATAEVDIETIEDDLQPVNVIVGSYITDMIIIDSSLISSGDEPTDATSLVVYLMAYGYSPTWPGATIYYGLAGDNYTPIMNAIGGGIIGHVTSDVIDTGMEFITDNDATIDIQLIDPSKATSFISVTDDDLLNGANRALIGNTGSWEVIQYRDVTSNGNGSLTLSGIIRGLRNTDHNMGSHSVGDFFVAISSQFVPQRQTVAESTIGQEAFYTARNANQQQILSTPQEYTVNGNSRKPWSPVDYHVDYDSGDFVISWSRRTKDDAPLVDGTGTVGLEFTQRRYEIDIYDDYSGNVVATKSVTGAETYTYTGSALFSEAFPHDTHSLNVVNGDAEAGTASWTSTSGALTTVSGTGRPNGTGRTFLANISPVLAHQDIDVSAYSTEIDAGEAKIHVLWYQDQQTQNVDGTAAIDIGFYDGSPGSLISETAGTQTSEFTGDLSYVLKERIVAIPVNTRTVRLTMNFPNSATEYIDDISCELWTLESSPVTLTFAVYQLSDDTLIGRGEGRKKTVDIQY